MRKAILFLVFLSLLVFLTANGIMLQIGLIILKITGTLKLTKWVIFGICTLGYVLSVFIWWLFYKVGRGLTK